jgi:hypothetical protein
MIKNKLKICLLGVGIYLLCSPVSAQTLLSEDFEGTVSDLTTAGWAITNNSDPVGTLDWFKPADSAVFAAHLGTDTSYVGSNFEAVDTLGTISNWLLTPSLSLQNGDMISFYTRATAAEIAPDVLEVRLSTAGNSTNVGATATSVGDFTTLLTTVNPNVTVGLADSYPITWTQYSVTLSGLASGGVTGRFAFRSTVIDGGIGGTNSDYLGVDTVRVIRASVAAPEPGTITLCLLGGIALFSRRRYHCL